MTIFYGTDNSPWLSCPLTGGTPLWVLEAVLEDSAWEALWLSLEVEGFCAGSDETVSEEGWL